MAYALQLASQKVTHFFLFYHRLYQYSMQILIRKLKNILPAFRAAPSIRRLASEIELLSSYSTDVIYRLRYSDMEYDYISPSVVKLLGFTPQEMKGVNLRSLILETRLLSQGMKKVLSYNALEHKRKQGGIHKWQADYLIRTKEGKTIWITDVSYPWFDEKGTIIGSIGSLRDITERVMAEERAREELARLAHTDALTGLANRREYFRRLEHELKRAHRTKGDLCILLIDVDYFKRINDTYGHSIGDFILAEIASILQQCVRETDVAARVGGEEFGILLTDTPSSGAYWVADRICTRIREHVFFADERRKVPLHCTVSIGVAGKDLDGMMDAASLYKEADTRLYIAKHTGRNRVSMDEVVNLH
ncbi:MAG: putative Diguanylate cyclase [Rickettsiales bacterium]|jgi:diguanylate cyclase (GGDEF)-like protein/PAS domain S-box-containing protein|nr:putative Diguanylate cyclase [Rickettsiales bacterium]